jgi:hypothetical protein
MAEVAGESGVVTRTRPAAGPHPAPGKSVILIGAAIAFFIVTRRSCSSWTGRRERSRTR